MSFNNNTKLLNTLTELGLTESQSLLYLTGLSLGKTTILNLSRESDLKRPTVYKLIGELVLKKLFLVVEQGWKTYYEAVNPKILYQILSVKVAELDQNYPALSSIYNSKNQIGFQYYEGLKEIKNLYSEILNETNFRDNYRVIGNQDMWLNLDKNFFERFIQDRNSMNPNIQMLFTFSDLAKVSAKLQARKNIKIKLLEPTGHYQQNLIITPNKVVIHNLTSPTSAYVLTQENIIASFNYLFDTIWNSTTPKTILCKL
jgi:HTH-type transcriptional regulator, sugar sensing transcriptional regulator